MSAYKTLHLTQTISLRAAFVKVYFIINSNYGMSGDMAQFCDTVTEAYIYLKKSFKLS